MCGRVRSTSGLAVLRLSTPRVPAPEKPPPAPAVGLALVLEEYDASALREEQSAYFHHLATRDCRRILKQLCRRFLLI